VAVRLNPDEAFLLFQAAAMLLFYTIQRITVPKLCIIRKAISLFNKGTTSQVRSFAMLLLSIVGN
jgi:hypothetical protein